jgi:hypothetical protein
LPALGLGQTLRLVFGSRQLQGIGDFGLALFRLGEPVPRLLRALRLGFQQGLQLRQRRRQPTQIGFFAE